LQVDYYEKLKIVTSQPAGFAMLSSNFTWKYPKHLEYLNSKLLQVASGKIKKLMINMPPQHGKSEFTSKYFPAWYLATHPSNKLILASYETSFAISWGRKAKEIFDESVPKYYGVRRNPNINVQGNWETEQGGSMYCVGVGGGITGRGANVFIIDDPVKNNEQAMSTVYREKTLDWYQSVASTRLAPESSIIIIMTRWHVDDLAGRLLKQAELDGDKWEIVNLPAFAEHNDPLGREVGEALWESRYSKKILEERKRQVGDFWWSAMYQQQPYIKGGKVFKDPAFYDNLPDGGKVIIAVDFAYSTKTYSDYSVAGVAKMIDDKIYLIDVWRGQVEATQFATIIKGYQEKYQSPIYCYIGGTEKGIVDFMRKENNLNIISKPARNDKFVRAQPVASAWNDGRILLPKNQNWVNIFLQEIMGFTGVSDLHDDQVDVLSTIYDSLSSTKKELWRIT
jgi:predicted phage terminase large subunit-like protein